MLIDELNFQKIRIRPQSSIAADKITFLYEHIYVSYGLNDRQNNYRIGAHWSKESSQKVADLYLR